MSWRFKAKNHIVVRAMLASFLLLCFLLIHPPAAEATLIFIQPGHGGSDSGAIGYGGFYELNINLDIALKLNALLQEHGIQTVITRTGDTDQDSNQNIDTANQEGADAFIDIHNEGSDNPSDSGDEMWYAPKSPADYRLATTVHAAVIKAIRTYGYKDVIDGGLTQADPADNWAIERGTMPAIVIECLYVTNPYEAQLLQTDSFQQALAQGIYNGIASYFRLPQESSKLPAITKPAAAPAVRITPHAKLASQNDPQATVKDMLKRNSASIFAGLLVLSIGFIMGYIAAKAVHRKKERRHELSFKKSKGGRHSKRL